MTIMSDRNLTYLQIPDAVKRRAKMAAAGLGLSLSEYVVSAILADTARLGVKDIDLICVVDDIAKEVGHA